MRSFLYFSILLKLLINISPSYSYTDVTVSSGINMGHSADKMSTGIAVADFDNNGWPDVFYTGYFFDSKLYFNDGSGNFSENPVFTIPDLTNAKCGSVAAGDYDNDGWSDLYVACWGNNFLLHNESGTGFTNQTLSSGTNHPARSEAVSWGDLNNDGLLDLVVAAFPETNPPVLTDPDNFDHIFLNQGDGTFSDVYTSFPIPEEIARPTLAMILTDIDFDNDLDIYILNDRLGGETEVGNTLFRNDGAGCGGWCFTNIASMNGADHPAYCMGIAVSDYDLDGDWDMTYTSLNEHIFLKNEGVAPALNFVEGATAAGVNLDTGNGWGTLMYDMNNDGWEDLYYVTDGGTPVINSNLLYINNFDGTFSNQTVTYGLTDQNPSQAAVWLDYNKDGLLDLSLAHFNIDYRLLQNDIVSSNHWIAFELLGGHGINRDAIGTKIYLNDGNNTQIRELRSGESRGSNNQLLMHFGTGAATTVDITIIWPDGLTQNINGLVTNQYHSLIYPPADFIFDNGFE